MEYALMTEPQDGGTYEELLAAAEWAQAAGLAAFARSDHYYSSRQPVPDATDAFATLAGLARDTDTIRLTVLVTPITFRHPAVIAKTAATIDQMSAGRLDLGVGTGWMELEHRAFGIPFPGWDERFARLTETLEYLRAAFTGKPAQFEGTHYSLDAESKPAPSGIRLIVGGSGKQQTPSLAGKYADEFNTFVAPADDLEPRVATMQEAATSAGRDPSSISVSLMGPVLTGRDSAEYQDELKRAADRRDLEPGELERRLSRAGIPIGPPERLGDSLAALDRAGVDRLYLQWFDLSDLDGIARMWESIQSATR